MQYTKCLDSLEKQNLKPVNWPSRHIPIVLPVTSNCVILMVPLPIVRAVLEVEPDNVKALIRRAQAFEAVERYRFALQDVKTVLAMPYSQVGKSNWDMCNMMQHRLNRTVQQLKAMSSN